MNALDITIQYNDLVVHDADLKFDDARYPTIHVWMQLHTCEPTQSDFSGSDFHDWLRESLRLSVKALADYWYDRQLAVQERNEHVRRYLVDRANAQLN